MRDTKNEGRKRQTHVRRRRNDRKEELTEAHATNPLRRTGTNDTTTRPTPRKKKTTTTTTTTTGPNRTVRRSVHETWEKNAQKRGARSIPQKERNERSVPCGAGLVTTKTKTLTNETTSRRTSMGTDTKRSKQGHTTSNVEETNPNPKAADTKRNVAGVGTHKHVHGNAAPRTNGQGTGKSTAATGYRNPNKPARHPKIQTNGTR